MTLRLSSHEVEPRAATVASGRSLLRLRLADFRRTLAAPPATSEPRKLPQSKHARSEASSGRLTAVVDDQEDGLVFSGISRP